MPLTDHLPPELNLSKAERAQLKLIERAARRSTGGRLLEVLSATIIPGLFLGMYAYFLYHAPGAGLALCKLHGTFYIPETGALEKLLRFPIGILILTVLLWAGAMYYLQSQRRLIYRIVTHIKSRSNDA